MNEINRVWVFVGNSSSIPSAIFSSKDEACKWVNEYKLSGLLTAYPIGDSVYQWAFANGHEKKDDTQLTGEQMANYSSSYLEHYHCSDGQLYE